MDSEAVTHAHLLQAIGRLETSVEFLSKALIERRDDVTRALDRIGKLEEKSARIMGASLLVAAVVPMVISVTALVVQHQSRGLSAPPAQIRP